MLSGVTKIAGITFWLPCHAVVINATGLPPSSRRASPSSIECRMLLNSTGPRSRVPAFLATRYH